MANTYLVKKEINGIEYTAQFNGIAAAVEALDDWRKDNENISISKMSKYVLDHVIVEPKGLTMDSFETLDELTEVVNFGRDVSQGKFREEAVKNAANRKG